MVPREPMSAGRANLGMMFGSRPIGVLRLTLWDGSTRVGRFFDGEFRIERPGAMGKHG